MEDIYQILRVRAGTPQADLQAAYIRLTDTYRMVRDFAEDPATAQLAAQKLEKLMEAGAAAGLTLDAKLPTASGGTDEELSKLRMALNSGSASAGAIRASDLLSRARALPESAEKHYLIAMAMLQTDSSFQGCAAAVPELSKAVKQDPGNEAYRGLLDAIQAQLEQYQQHQQLLAEKAEQARQRQEREAQEAIREARTRENTSACLGTVGYLLLEYGLPLLGCCCVVECCKEGC